MGQWYQRFAQPTDEEVAELLDRAATGAPEPEEAETAEPLLRDNEVHVIAGNIELAGHLTIPADPVGLVVFAHPSGSNRHSPRNRSLADALQQGRLGTLLFDLLTPEEEIHRTRVFDIGLLATRLVDVTEWLTRQPHTEGLRIGYFGVDTGAAAALRAATDPRVEIAAVVSRSGRPDLTRDALARDHAPTLLIVGRNDPLILKLNQRAQAAMSCATTVTVVPGDPSVHRAGRTTDSHRPDPRLVPHPPDAQPIARTYHRAPDHRSQLSREVAADAVSGSRRHRTSAPWC
ncbi:hypothetical protein DFR76_11565 [Nocardia pseudobrasiliensis]|uniref:Dienelactone hydrolase n=1 Tax=Nocardia pseudobrasiliensis TaxID=45979 RepID=A0A370HQ77_9NOCA|nr:hypothetical protein DFR76_11565 [Nocardia pseudobrasiliensis]